MSLSDVDISALDPSRGAEKPPLDPLPEEPPETPVEDGWNRGARDWAWSELRHQLDTFTGGAASYNDEYYDLGYTLLEILETRARERAFAFPSDEAREWTRAGLRAASYSVAEEGTLRLQGPSNLPEFMLEKALVFAVRRADRALSIWGQDTDSVDRDFPDGFIVPEKPSSEEPPSEEHSSEEHSSEDPSNGPDEPPQQRSLF